MGRPTSPLILPATVVATALEIIDAEGVDGLSIRTLGTRLGVNGSSLYHHFTDKQGILDQVVAFILSDLEPLIELQDDMEEWMVTVSVAYRQALLAHPNAIELVVDQFPLEYRRTVEATLFEHFRVQGVSERYWYPILEQIQAFNFGSAHFGRDRARTAKRSSALIDESHFRVAVRCLFRSLLEHYRALSGIEAGAAS